MTNEEAKELLLHILMTYEPKDQYGDYDDPKLYDLALTMAIEALTMAIEALSESRWIPVSERLPEEDGWYLVTVQGYETVTDVSLYSADGCAWGDVSTKQKVIAWMPLPMPYREESEVEE